ncbi:MAG: hypothetical protein JJT81_00575 [Rubellimicrobium sp.]|nr:hypothetical protein [Rubellimicrobium sp.]
MNRTAALALCLTMLAVQTHAQDGRPDFPAQFEVTGVAEDDRLNIRAEPSANAPILDSFYAYAFNIEVIETTPDGTWGLVGISEGNGWVNMRFLARSDIFPYELPRPLACIGTEPFWRIGLYPRGDEFEMMGDMRRDLNRVHEAVGENGFLARLEEGPTLERTLIVEKGQCSDGMSDRRYGWHATLFTEAPDGNYVLSGCCTLDGNF